MAQVVNAGPSAVLTRAEGKNGKLRHALEQRSVACVELPLVAHVRTHAHASELPRALLWAEGEFRVLVTSPEAASSLSEAWSLAHEPPVRALAAVGHGTFENVNDRLLHSASSVFVPSVANAITLAAELEPSPPRALLPTSARAGTELEDALTHRGFSVWRVDAYTTQAATDADAELVRQAQKCDVVTLASPSAIDAWRNVVGTLPTCAACIGSTTADAARSEGIERVYAPDSPGIEGWAEACTRALTDCRSLEH